MTAARSSIGTLDCPHCGQKADVCKNKSEKLYYRCARCGISNMHGAQFQEWILANATFFPNASPPVERPAPKPKPKPAPAKPAPAKPDDDGDDDDEPDDLEPGDFERGESDFERDLGL